MNTKIERYYWSDYSHVCGVDEVGRGTLAGAVVAAAVMFERHFIPKGILKKVNDSKQIDPPLRAELADEIKRQAIGVGIGVIDPKTIDRVNILNATFLAMTSAIEQIFPTPEFLLIDGNRFRSPLLIPYETIIQGDASVFSIAAASIVAKVHRDELMTKLATKFPEYGFQNHFGYAVPEHIAAIKAHGRSRIHRKSFKLKALGEK